MHQGGGRENLLLQDGGQIDPKQPASPSPVIRHSSLATAQALNSTSFQFHWPNPGYKATADGAYYDIDGQVDIGDSTPMLPKSVLGFTQQVRQPLFLGGSFVEIGGFDPVISRAVNDSTGLSVEPGFGSTEWFPQLPFNMRDLQVPAGEIAKVVVVAAAQYQGDRSNGTLRKFDDASFVVYSSAAADQDLPMLGLPEQAVGPGTLTVAIDGVSDASGIYRVVLSYSTRTSGTTGQWQSVDLVQESPGGGRYVGTIDAVGPVEYFIQAVDNAGNVNRSLPEVGYYNAQVEWGVTPTPTATGTPGPSATPTATPTAAATVVPVAVEAGWTLLALPGPAATPYTAGSLAAELTGQGMGARQAARWENGRWESHLPGFPANDFPVEVGRGYFVKTTAAGTWGARVAVGATAPEVAIQAGWTLIARPGPNAGPGTASGLIQALAGPEIGASQVARWQQGQWESHLGGSGGDGFAIEAGRGYFVKTSGHGRWRP